MTVIELGDITPGSDLPEATAPPGYDRRAVRRFALAVVAVVVLLAVTGSARPEPTMLRVLWSIPFGAADRFTVAADAVHAVTGDQLTSYDLSSGAVRWSVPMPEPTGWPTEAEAAAVVLLPADRVAKQINSPDGGSYLLEYYRWTVAVDARTGAELWRRPGEVYATTRDAALLVDRAGDGSGTMLAFRLVGLRDGGVRWDRPGAGAVRTAVGGADPLNPDALVTVTATGDATTLRIADGTPIASGHLDFRVGSPQDGDFVDMVADRRNLYLRQSNGRGDTLTAYALATLSQVWRLAGTARVSAYPCGAVVCSVQSDATIGLDPETGAIRWRVPGAQSAWPVAPGRLLSDEGLSGGFALVDEATGRRIGPVGVGIPVAAADGTAAYLLGNTPSSVYRTVVSRIDLVTGEIAVRGMIDRTGEYGCTATADRLVCPTTSGRLEVAAVG